MLKYLGAAALCLLAVGCEDAGYLIEAGEHYADGVNAAAQISPELHFEATFDDSAIYATEDPRNQHDINKLYGFSDCSSHHHTNSARFGWRWLDGALEIFAYIYVDGERMWEHLGDATIGEASHYDLVTDGAEYVFTFDGTTVRMPRGCAGDGGVKYRLYPYFGGDETAPHDITIEIVDD